MKIDYNTIYYFDFTGRISFGELSKETVYQLFQDGRVISKFLEHYVPIWFPELKFVDASGYDHVDVATGLKKWDLKGFTIKSGARYMPSNMIGGGRVKNLQEAHAHAHTIDYIFSDIIDFPKIRIQFKSGTELVTRFPAGEIPVKHRDELFDGTTHVTGVVNDCP
jgi:hypothetical protein